MDRIAQEGLRSRLDDYVARRIEPRELWLWTMERIVAPEIDRRDPGVRVLVAPLLRYLSEYQLGHRTDEDLRSLITELASRPLTV